MYDMRHDYIAIDYQSIGRLYDSDKIARDCYGLQFVFLFIFHILF